MPIFKLFSFALLLIVLGGCATRLESTRDYMAKGDKKSASEALIEHAQERSIAELAESEYKTGIDFLTILEEINSPSLLTQIYNLKYSSSTYEMNSFIRSGRFSSTILRLTQKWQILDLESRIARQIEAEIPSVTRNKYNSDLIEFASFATIYLSAKNLNHDNLSAYWGKMPYEKYLVQYKIFWDRAKTAKAQSISDVLKTNFLLRIRENREQILDVADQKELTFIFSREKEFTEKSEFYNLRLAMNDKIQQGRKNEKIALSDIEVLEPRVLALSERLQKLKTERRDLQISNRYTYEERVKCPNCGGSGVIIKEEIRRERAICRTCHGRGWYRRCDRVWDSCRGRYVNVYVRTVCPYCHGSGYVRGRTYRVKLSVPCPYSDNGMIIKLRKTAAGKDIDNRIQAAETQQSAMLSRLNKLEWIVRRERARREAFQGFCRKIQK